MLGIGDLEIDEDAGEAKGAGSAGGEGGAGGGGSSADEGGASGSGGAGNAGSPGSAGSGGGKAGSGGGKAGSSGGKAGSSGTSPVDTVESCQAKCRAQYPERHADRLFEVLEGCACESDELPSCAAACGGTCALSGFEGQSAQCVACFAAKFDADECEGQEKECKGPCEEFAECLEACGSP